MNEPLPVPSRLEVFALALPEITAGADLADLISAAHQIQDGDVVVITSKVISKAEGRAADLERRDAVAAESVRVLARRGDSVIAETRHGLVMAAAGVDGSNVDPGSVLLLPVDPDASARQIRARLHTLTGCNVAVVVSDTAGRAWRNGQTDMAIGCAGILPAVDLNGVTDTHGNVLNVTAPAVADELTSTADLVQGKATGRPVAIVRGYSEALLAPEDHGPGAATLIREAALDMFGIGAREAALAAAVRDDPQTLAHFPPRTPPDPDPFTGLDPRRDGVVVRVRREDVGEAPGWRVRIDVPEPEKSAMLAAGRVVERAHVLAAAYRLRLHADRQPAEPTAVADLHWIDPNWADTC